VNVNGQDAVGLSRRCPATWTKYGLRCFKFFSHPTNWITAEVQKDDLVTLYIRWL